MGDGAILGHHLFTFGEIEQWQKHQRVKFRNTATHS